MYYYNDTIVDNACYLFQLNWYCYRLLIHVVPANGTPLLSRQEQAENQTAGYYLTPLLDRVKISLNIRLAAKRHRMITATLASKDQ